MTPGPSAWCCAVSRPDLTKIENEITPLLSVHGVELVALEWFQGPGHGILRVTIDRPGGDPREQDPAKSVGLDEVTGVTRDVSTAMDALDLIEGAYTLEIGSPGTERPLQKRADYERFAGLRARIETRSGEGRSNFSGALRGVRDLPDGEFAVKIEVAPTVEREIPAHTIVRAKLHEIAPPRKDKPGKGSSRRQERLAAREKARAINAAHLQHKQQGAAAPRDGASPAQGASAVDTTNQNNPHAPDAAVHTAGERVRNGKR